MKSEMINELKKVMNYTEVTKCCSSCISFRAQNGSTMIGSTQPDYHGDQCVYNAVAIPVSTGGCCEFFTERHLLASFSSQENINEN